LYNFQVQVSGTEIDSQRISALVVFDYPDSSVLLSANITVNVVVNSNVVSFSASPTTLYLSKGQTKPLEYEAIYQNFIANVGTKNSVITAIVEDQSVVNFDMNTKILKGMNEGESSVILTYKGLSDTVYVTVRDNLSNQISTQLLAAKDWNLISVPSILNDFSKRTLFPTSISSAFAYNFPTGYKAYDTLTNGIGYWVKFSEPQPINYVGQAKYSDTIIIQQGWKFPNRYQQRQ